MDVWNFREAPDGSFHCMPVEDLTPAIELFRHNFLTPCATPNSSARKNSPTSSPGNTPDSTSTTATKTPSPPTTPHVANDSPILLRPPSPYRKSHGMPPPKGTLKWFLLCYTAPTSRNRLRNRANSRKVSKSASSRPSGSKCITSFRISLTRSSRFTNSTRSIAKLSFFQRFSFSINRRYSPKSNRSPPQFSCDRRQVLLPNRDQPY